MKNLPATTPPPKVPLTEPARITLEGIRTHWAMADPTAPAICIQTNPFKVGLATKMAEEMAFPVTGT